MSKLEIYCNDLYRRFAEEAKGSEVGLVWYGKLTKTASAVGIPDGMYKRVVDKLTEIGSVSQVERGAYGKPTVIILHDPPTAERFAEADERVRKPLTGRDAPAILSRRLSDLEGRLEGIDIKLALKEVWQELESLRRQVKSNSNTQGEK